MTIRRLIQVLFATLSALALLSAVLITVAGLRRRHLVDLEERRFQSYQLAQQVRRSSDELTRFARTFVVTADPKYERYYRDVLEIRAGKQPMPLRYSGAYWDLVIDRGSPSGEVGPALSLARRMEIAGISPAELDLLGRALSVSDSLVAIEETALHAVRGQFRDATGAFTRVGPPNQALAIRIMHDSTYHHQKARIMAPIDSFLASVEARTNDELAVFKKQTAVAFVVIESTFALFVILVLVSYPILQARVLTPVSALQIHTRGVATDINKLADVSTKISQGDLTQSFSVATAPVGSRRPDEIGDLSRLHDSMLGQLQSTGGAIAAMTGDLKHANEALTVHVGELDEARRYLASILDTTPMAVGVTVKSICQYANPTYRELFEAEVGRPLGNIYADLRDRERMVEELESGGTVRDWILKLRSRDGRIIDALCAFYLIDFGGERGILGWIVDITKMKETEAALRELERLRDDLVHMIVHDMRSPLTVLLSQLQLLQMDATGEMAESIGDAMRGARTLNQLANAVLDVSRLEEGKMPLQRTPTDLASLAQGVASTLAALETDRKITVEASGAVMSSCDAGLVQRVIENLVSNAVKHTPRGGGVRIAVSATSGRVRVAVQDEGAGVPEEARARIFEKFASTAMRKDSQYHSAGLGLAFCKLAVEAHGGTIRVEDATPRGSAFVFELPA